MLKVFRLSRNQRIRMDGKVSGRVVSCREGMLWLTQTGNPGDHLLRAGETFSSDRSGRLVISALADSVFMVEAGNAVPQVIAWMFLHAMRETARRIECIRRRLLA